MSTVMVTAERTLRFAMSPPRWRARGGGRRQQDRAARWVTFACMTEPATGSPSDVTGAAADPLAEAVGAGYSFDGPALELGALMLDAERVADDVPVRVPLGMLNRHGLVAGATGTGKTKTLQLLAE